jgi:hypothetical protein
MASQHRQERDGAHAAPPPLTTARQPIAQAGRTGACAARPDRRLVIF